MSALDIICLANSGKHGGRCVAGIDMESKRWIRLVGCTDGNALSHYDSCYPDKRLPAVLDMVRVPVLYPAPLGSQPENWVIDKNQWWENLGQYPARQLVSYCYSGSYIFCDCADYLTAREAFCMVPTRSLLLIKPNDVVFENRVKPGKGLQVRTHFYFAGGQYDLVVTDTVWEGKLKKLGVGCWQYQHGFLFIISLGQEWKGRHYKLVAGIVVIPNDECFFG